MSKLNNQHWYVELRHQGDYVFKLTQNKLLASATVDQPVIYDPNTRLVTIPSVSYANYYFRVTLSNTGNNLFKLNTECDESHRSKPMITGGDLGKTGPNGGIIFAPNLESQSKDANAGGKPIYKYQYTDGSTQYFYTWEEARNLVSGNDGSWHLPTKNELNLLCQQQALGACPRTRLLNKST